MVIDPNTVFTGGMEIKFQNMGIINEEETAHIALEGQPLLEFVKAVLTEKGRPKLPFEIVHFDAAKSLLVVEAYLTSRIND